MKKLLVLAAIMLLTASCSNERETLSVEQENEYGEVRVHVNDFAVSVDNFPDSPSMTRSESDVLDYTDLKVVTLAFYDASGTEVYKAEQNKEISSSFTGTFGVFSCNLPIGVYTMVAIGRGYYTGDEFTLTSPTSAAYSSEKPRETFTYTQQVTVTNTSTVNLSVTMNRICSKLFILSNDNRVATVSKIRVTYSKGGKGFNPTTGFSTTDAGFPVNFTTLTAVGNPVEVKSYLFLASDEETMNVTIEAMDNNNVVLFTKVVNDVPFKRNRVTKLTGNVFTAGATSAGFKVETDWITESVVNF